ncbi:MAG: PA0069 family radical SAM protein [Phycisphaerae bacterium]|nr:PA0069 family radical SAM protein [Phycisphaerae bacterium]
MIDILTKSEYDPLPMLRRVNNPRNPYLSESREWLEPPPAAELEVYEESAKSILSENDSPDIPFRWSLNPYRGCQHACAYCYARTTHEYLGMGAGTDFDTRLVAKINAPDLLRAAFSKRGWSRESICFSGVTDCYQPIEAVYRLTRRCLEVCLEFRNPVSIVTKGCLVLRDLELLVELQRQAGARLYQSVAFADDRMARLIEPQAPPPSKRFEVMARLREAGIPVGVMVAPIIPGLNDTQVPQILEAAARSGAASAAYTSLRLARNVAPVFLDRIRESLPQRADRIESRIREMRSGQLNDPAFGDRMSGRGVYWESIERLFRVSAEKYGLALPGDRPKQAQTKSRGSGNEPGRRGRPRRSRGNDRSLPLFPDHLGPPPS